jgi:hypothetical protein
MNVHHDVDAGTPRTTKALPGVPNIKVILRYFHRHCPRAARCGSLLEGLRSLKFKLRMEHSEHEHLRGSGCQSVILYVYVRCVYCYVFFQLRFG